MLRMASTLQSSPCPSTLGDMATRCQCLHLYIMGDGIGKGTHLSLFFVVMRGEFDNILQWPFTHKVTFKLINQAGGRDIVDTFQPDPMSSSFRKPKSDMNVLREYLYYHAFMVQLTYAHAADTKPVSHRVAMCSRELCF